MEILGMGRHGLLALREEGINRFLTSEEVVHMAKTLGAFWTYDYEAAKQGRVGKHALLKSGLHSDGFFVSRILLDSENIRLIISAQIAMRLREVFRVSGVPDCITGVPDGATKIGEDVAGIFGAKNVKMEKVDGRIVFVTPINPRESILLVEDFCTRGTGLTEAVGVVKEAQPQARIFPYEPVIINRGGLKQIHIEGVGAFKVIPVVEWKVQDWDPKICPLCLKGSDPIKPKETDENWQKLITSQL
jgi:orotate phosphoribosyltransferase